MISSLAQDGSMDTEARKFSALHEMPICFSACERACALQQCRSQTTKYWSWSRSQTDKQNCVHGIHGLVATDLSDSLPSHVHSR